MWSKSQLEQLKKYGIDTDKLGILDINQEVIAKLELFAEVIEFNEQELFKRELKRVLKPSN